MSLYYLKSRYYDPEIGRFISPDSIDYLNPSSINGLNLYAYCENDPINNYDPSGHFAITTLLISMAIGFGIGAGIGGGFEIGKQIHLNGWNPTTWDWGQIGLSTLGGGVAGAITAISIPGGGFLSYLGTFLLGGTASVVGGLITGSVNSWETVALAFVIGGVANVLAKGISDKITQYKSAKIFNQGNKAKSLSVQRLQGHPLNMGSQALKGNMRNAFKQTTQ